MILYEYYDDGTVYSQTHQNEDGMLHSDKPSFIEYYKNGEVKREIYYWNDRCHNSYGPADIHYDIDGNIQFVCYYLEGADVTATEFFKKTRYKKIKDIL